MGPPYSPRHGRTATGPKKLTKLDYEHDNCVDKFAFVLLHGLFSRFEFVGDFSRGEGKAHQKRLTI